MNINAAHKEAILKHGYTIIENVFSIREINAILDVIEKADTSNDTFRKTKELFAIRQFLKEVPEVLPFIFNNRFNDLISQLFGNSYFVVKSIYFDKPASSNWFVSYHQDLTISVKEKVDTPQFGPWTVKQDQFAVQPPLAILENNFTIRIHLDDTGEDNGALRIIKGSHLKGIYRPETIDRSAETEIVCSVPAGGIMIMKPLLLHSSGRTSNGRQRRVIHIEFSNKQLPTPLHWSELIPTAEFSKS